MQGSVKYHFFAYLAGRCLSVFPDAPTHVPGWAYQSQPHDNEQPSKSILECGGVGRQCFFGRLVSEVLLDITSRNGKTVSLNPGLVS